LHAQAIRIIRNHTQLLSNSDGGEQLSIRRTA
jgi:hypothetical protein